MSRILTRSLLLAVLVVALLGVCDAILRATVPATIFERKLSMLDSQDFSNVEVAVFGTSRAYQGVDPKFLAWKSYNFADLGQSFYQSCQLFEHFAPHMPHLGGVIITVDEFGFGTVEDPGVALDYDRHGYPAEHPTWDMRLRESSPLIRYRRDLLPMIMARVTGKSFFEVKPIIQENPDPAVVHHDRLIASTGLQWVPPIPRDYTADIGRKRAEQRLAAYEPKYRSENVRNLERFIRLCQSHGARVLLIRTPMTEVYRDAVNTKMLSEFHADLATVLHDCGTPDVTFKSYWDAPNFTPIEFADVDHLDSTGAQHFSQLLSRDTEAFFRGPHLAQRP